MQCAVCAASNRENARFCSECGSPFARLCTSCNAQLNPGARFCDECGTPVADKAAAQETGTPTAVRKTVTVVFCDLGGSTRFGEHTDAELAREVMGRYHAILQDVIDAHDGTVAKFMGDGMMALFGIPEIAEDDAPRAVRAGSELQRRFATFAAEVEARHGEVLTMRVGVNTGEVVIADGDADLVGDALNVASRLEKACRPGHVLVGEDTWRLTRAEFGYEPLGEVTVAGRGQPVLIYEVALETARAAEPVAPFVGRDAEMRRLTAVFGVATASRSAQLATVLGSPGVGKTRLSRELCAYVQTAADAGTFEIRCDRAGDATFAPIASLIREATGLGDDADGPTARSHLGALLDENEADRGRLIEVLAGLVGAAPARSVEETFWAIRRLVESVAATRPTVIVIDDIQWAEPLLLDLLEHLTEWVHDVPVLLLCLARPELRSVRPAFTEIGRRVTEVLALDGLDSAATEQLAAGLLGTDRLPVGLVNRLPVSTDGNPLFVRELVRMLVDDQIITRRDGEWELTIDADAVEVPPTIQSLLAARVERLPRDERQLLEFASVVGAEFSLGALRELAGEGTSIAPLLESMRRKELVEPTGTYWGDEPVHRFHHVLIRDAAYRRLLKTTRADLHERVGVWTDRTAATLIGEHEGAIAYHYEQAYQYRRELGISGGRLDDLGRRAAELLNAAANRALGRDDLAAAGALASRALGLLPEVDVAARADLLLVGCECLLASGDVVAGRTLVEQLAEVAADDAGLEAWAACFAAQLVGLTDPEALLGADEVATTAAATLHGIRDTAGEAKAHQVRAGLLARLGRVGEAEVELELALEAARSVDDGRRVTAVLGAAPNAALWGPSPVARAGGRCLDVLRLLRITSASPSVEATSMRCQAVLEALRGRFDVSRSMIASARASLEELGLRHGLMETELFAGIVELIAGDSAAAVAPLRAAYGGLGAMGVGADAGQAAALLSRALLALGEIDEADQMATASEALAGQNLKTAISWRVARGEVLSARGDAAAGVALAEAAVEIAAATDYMIDHADACVALMGLREAAGDVAGARAARAEALRLYQAKGASVPAARLADSSDRVAADRTGPEATAAPASIRATSADAGLRVAKVKNLATRLTNRFAELMSAGRFDETRSLFPPDHVWMDHRRIVAAPTTTGYDDMMAATMSFIDVGFVTVAFEPIAERGENLELYRVIARTADEREVVVISVTEIGVTGLAAYTGWYDEDDLRSAIADLDDRYLSGEGAAHADLVRALNAGLQSIERQDWEELRASVAPEFAALDHRDIGWPELDRHGLVEFMRGYGEVVQSFLVTSVLVAGRAILATIDNHAIDPTDGAYQWRFHTVNVVDDLGRTTWMELFAEDDFARALARLDELGAVDARTPRAENAATRLAAHYAELLLTGHVDDADALYASDHVFVDRRRVVSAGTIFGSDSLAASFRAFVELGFTNLTIEPMAVRGGRSHVSRLAISTADGREVVLLGLTEIDASQFVYTAWFDEDDFDAAMDELDERYIAGEGAQHADVLTAARALERAGRLHDFDAMLDLLSPDFVVADHRPLLFGEGDRDYFVRASRSTSEAGLTVIRDVNTTVHVVGRTVLVVQSSRRLTEQGTMWEWNAPLVARFDSSGRASRVEFFGEDEFPAALARLDELGAALSAPAAGPPPLDNRAVQAFRRGVELARAGAFDAFDEVFAEDISRIDRRAGVAAPDGRGRDGAIEDVGALNESFDNVIVEPLAVRGDRLALSRHTYVSAGDVELTVLSVYDLNDKGLLSQLTVFDESQLEAAFDELEDRYCADEGAEHEYVVRRVGDFFRAYQRRDWDAIEAFYAPDCVAVDHRRLGYPLSDRASIVGMLWALVDLVPDVVHRYRTLEVCGDVSLACAEAVGTTADGSSYSWMFCSVTQFVAGRGVRVEAFDAEQYDEARARFEELAAETRTPHVDNATVRLIRRVVWMVKFGGIERAQEQLFDRDIVRIDRRSGIASPTMHGSTAIVDNLRAAYGVFGDITIEPLAVRGERLVLSKLNYISSEGFESPGLVIYESSAAGLLCRIEIYDEGDLVAVLDDLDARYEHVRDSEAGACERTLARDRDAFHRRDLGALEQFYAPEFVVLDHRLLGFPTADRAQYLERSRDFAAATSELTTFGRKSYYAARAGIGVTGFVGRSSEGSEYAWELIGVVRTDAQGRFTRFEYFPEDQWDEALALFDSWNTTPLDLEIENAVSHAVREALALCAQGDFDAVADRFLSDQVRHESRRRVLSAPPTNGRGPFIANLRALFDVFGGLTAETIAVRGSQLVLMRGHLAAPDGFEQFLLLLFEADHEGRVIGQTTFDEDDLIAALNELEDRYCAGQSGEHAFLIRQVGDGTRACARRDLPALEQLFSAELRAVDHRLMGFPLSDRASFVAMQQTLETVASGAVPVFRTLEVRGSAVMGLVETRGTTADGNRYEWGSITVSRNVVGKVGEIELFGVDQPAAARTRFEEWASDGPTPDIDNAVVRRLRRAEWLRVFDDADAAVDLVAEDMVVIDHRRGFSLGVVQGRGAFFDLADASVEVFGSTERDREYLAVRGERLALARSRTAKPDGFEVVKLDLLQADAAGRLCRWDVFDDADLLAALDELDSQYREIRGQELSTIEQVGGAMVSAFNHRDWDALTASISPDVVVVDHSPLGFGTSDRDGYVNGSLRTLVDLALDALTIGAKGYFRGLASIAMTPVVGTTPEGNRYAWIYIYVMRLDSNRRVDRIATFAPDQWDDALGQFDQWSCAAAAPAVENSVSRTVHAALAAVAAGDGVIAAGSQFAAENIERFDRRRGISAPTVHGRDAFNESVRAIFDVFGSITAEEVAVRGDLLALMRVRFAAPDGFEEVMLTLYEADGAGKQARLVTFDDDDLMAALDELEDRYCAGEGSGDEYMIRRVGDGIRAFARRDWSAFERLLAPDMRATDHRPMGFPLHDRASFVAMQESLVEVAPDANRIFRTLEVGGNALMGRIDGQGTSLDGNLYVWEGLLVLRTIGGETVDVALFALEQAGAARARFDEWRSDTPSPELDNRAGDLERLGSEGQPPV